MHPLFAPQTLLAFLCLGFLTFGTSLRGQTYALPPIPEDRLIDESHFFDKEQKATVRAAMQQIAENEKIGVYLVVESYIEDGTLQLYLDRLCAEWMPSTPGMVMGYERGSGQFSVATNTELSEMIPYPIQRMILTEVFTPDENGAKPAVRLISSVNSLVDRFAEFTTSKEEARKLFSPRNLILVTAAIPVLAGFLFLTRMLVLKEHAGERKRNRTLLFPQVNVPARLGGDFSGGVGVSSTSAQTQDQVQQATGAASQDTALPHA